MQIESFLGSQGDPDVEQRIVEIYGKKTFPEFRDPTEGEEVKKGKF